MSMSKAASTPIKCENLMDLNDDCLLYLLRFFDLLELMNLRGVCRRLDNLILQSRSRFATLDFETVPRKYGAKLLKIFKFLGPEMKSLALDTGRDNLCSNLRDKSVVLDWINEHCVNLESYDHHSIDLSELRTFQKFRPIVKRLKALSLNYVEFDDRLGESFKDARLEALEIVYNENITEKFFKNVSTLKSLDLGGCSKLTSDSYIQILKKNLTLKKLSININSLIGSNSKQLEGSNKLVDFIANNLHEIEELTFDVMSSNIENLGELPNLKKLRIYTGKVELHNALDKLMEKLSQKDVLEELSIFGAKNQSLNMDLVSKLSSLKSLRLSGIQKLKDCELSNLQKLVQLEFLEVFHLDIKNDSTVLNLVKSLPKLTSLSLSLEVRIKFIEQLIQILKQSANRPKFKLYVDKVLFGHQRREYRKLLKNNLNVIYVEIFDVLDEEDDYDYSESDDAENSDFSDNY